MDEQELDHRFTYHQVTKEGASTMKDVRTMLHTVADYMVNCSPRSREQSLAITKLEEASMWFNASLARNQEEK